MMDRLVRNGSITRCKATGLTTANAGGDFLLIYQIEGGCIVFVRAGTHAELFE